MMSNQPEPPQPIQLDYASLAQDSLPPNEPPKPFDLQYESTAPRERQSPIFRFFVSALVVSCLALLVAMAIATDTADPESERGPPAVLFCAAPGVAVMVSVIGLVLVLGAQACRHLFLSGRSASRGDAAHTIGGVVYGISVVSIPIAIGALFPANIAQPLLIAPINMIVSGIAVGCWLVKRVPEDNGPATAEGAVGSVEGESN